ncbi:hypothetical protein A2U01_0110137, partial [Trifolium medium]|nr:hypothetical protein [Trifolium medium]
MVRRSRVPGEGFVGVTSGHLLRIVQLLPRISVHVFAAGFSEEIFLG